MIVRQAAHTRVRGAGVVWNITVRVEGVACAQHDAQLDYYGRRLATCASDKTVRVFEVDGNGGQRLLETLRKHDGPVWQVAWAHPRFGSVLASCAYDGTVVLWGDVGGRWEALFHHRAHQASGAPRTQIDTHGDDGTNVCAHH
jgi:WD40 repeat protein